MAERILAMMMAPLFTHIWFILHLIKFPFFQQNTTDLSSLFLLLLKENINSVSSQCLRYDWTLYFAGHCSFRRTLHSVIAVHTCR